MTTVSVGARRASTSGTALLRASGATTVGRAEPRGKKKSADPSRTTYCWPQLEWWRRPGAAAPLRRTSSQPCASGCGLGSAASIAYGESGGASGGGGGGGRAAPCRRVARPPRALRARRAPRARGERLRERVVQHDERVDALRHERLVIPAKGRRASERESARGDARDTALPGRARARAHPPVTSDDSSDGPTRGARRARARRALLLGRPRRAERRGGGDAARGGCCREGLRRERERVRAAVAAFAPAPAAPSSRLEPTLDDATADDATLARHAAREYASAKLGTSDEASDGASAAPASAAAASATRRGSRSGSRALVARRYRELAAHEANTPQTCSHENVPKLWSMPGTSTSSPA